MDETVQGSGVEISPEAPALRIESSVVSNLNLAAFQNAVPVFGELSIVNDSSLPLSTLVVRVESFPAFFKTRTWHIDAIASQSKYRIPRLDFQLDGVLLGRLTEAETATITVTILGPGDGDTAELARQEKTIELLPRNQWGGSAILPELIAAFVQPNEPAIDRLLKQAAEILRKSDRSPAIDGYKQGAKHAWEVVSAIWGALSARGLDYALPPASFEASGQKVRSASQIMDAGLATCLDLTLLCCSALEQASLNSLVIFTKGHAFAGVWLKKEEFSTPVVDDITALRKRIQLKELVLFETTTLTHRPVPRFSYAVELGTEHLSEAKEPEFQFAIDISRARLQRVKPLASVEASVSPDGAAEAAMADEQPPIEDIPDLPEFSEAEDEVTNIDPNDRLARWQRKLLDLSLRNNLLNFNSRKKTLKLEAPDPGALEDLLADGGEIKLLPRPKLMEANDPRNQAIHEARENEQLRREHALGALRKREVFLDLSKTDLEAQLLELYRSARGALQEGGANTLFLAIGFLTWRKEDKAEDKRYRAPLILLPVTLKRKSVRSGFTLMLHDDDPIFNPTLIEMLRQDFQLDLGVPTGELPKDDSGLDVDGIWRIVSRAVKDIEGWEVVEDVVLSVFSFAKYLMWKDLIDCADQVKENAVVNHLIDAPKKPYASGEAFRDARSLDKEFVPADFFCPLPADSSQLSAVMAAARGKDFVLIGPPGTGKSQTIANLIAQCLAENKRVLFVSQKISALDVVYRRLRDIGLGEFCLELHSNKARKVDVLAQLKKSWDTREGADAQTWQARADQLKILRDELNVYAEQLHARHTNGMTIYDAIGCISTAKEVVEVPIKWPDAEVHDRAAMTKLRDLVGRLEVNVKAVGQAGLSQHPLAAVGQGNWSPTWSRELTNAAHEIAPLVQALLDAYKRFSSAAGIPATALDGHIRRGTELLARCLPGAAGRDWGFLLKSDARAILERLHAGIALAAEYRAFLPLFSLRWAPVVPQGERGQGAKEIINLKKQLSVGYTEQVSSLDLSQLEADWKAAEETSWLFRGKRKRKVQERLAECVVGDKAPDPAVDIALLRQITVLHGDLRKKLEQSLAALNDLRDMTSGVWQGLDTLPAVVNKAQNLYEEITVAIGNIATTPEQAAELTERLERLVGPGNMLLETGGLVASAASAYLEASGTLQRALDRLASLGAFGSDRKVEFETLSLTQLAEQCSAIAAASHELNAWCGWQRIREEAIGSGLAPLVTAIEAGHVGAQEIQRTFEINYSRWWLNAIVENEPAIRNFVSAEHEKRIKDFRALDEQFTQLTRSLLRARLCADLPDQDDDSRNSEWGILNREIHKQARHMPLRELMIKIPTVLSRLAPCLLMSPLSIAQYLSAKAPKFDLVVFDEASQIPVWDAIGAMARGTQVVMVGDPKQLPPTNFFGKAESGEADQDVEPDMESILDECIGANLPTMELNWHYRSRHESLIAFSNHYYYGDKLVTFPSPETKDTAVNFHFVNGVYEKGSARTNPAEAKALVADIVGRLRSPSFRASEHTVGVVTFNTEQKKLIEDLLDAERRKDPSIEPYFDEGKSESLFVKNLESVQGDERDIIYFSITFGPDRTGAISMNFGPMNGSGGERRLNVAVTRAREEMRVFSSLHPEQLDLSRTPSLGVRDLKHFLEFAERGARALAESNDGSVGGFESPFEESVAKALASKGWQLQTQIGVSRFRIDLGVVDPDAPGRYLTGLECDGATYHRSATARDRDKLREQVLRGLGWEILRVWSTDWWINPEGTLAKLDAGLHKLLEVSRIRRAEEQAREDEAERLATDAIAKAREDAGIDERDAPESERDGTHITNENAESESQAVSKTADSENYAQQVSAPRVVPSGATYFKEADPSDSIKGIDSERFYDDAYDDILRQAVEYIVEIEGPILDMALAQRIARAHHFQRTGARIRERVDRIAQQLGLCVTKEKHGCFYWPSSHPPEMRQPFRSPSSGVVRGVDEICMQELVALAADVLSADLSGEDACVVMARKIGLGRLRATTRERLQAAVRVANSY